MNIIKICDSQHSKKIVFEHIAGYYTSYNSTENTWNVIIMTCSGESIFTYPTEKEARSIENKMDALLGYSGQQL